MKTAAERQRALKAAEVRKVSAEQADVLDHELVAVGGFERAAVGEHTADAVDSCCR